MSRVAGNAIRFLQFTITVQADGGPVTLDLTGPHGTQEFLSAMFRTVMTTTVLEGRCVVS